MAQEIQYPSENFLYSILKVESATGTKDLGIRLIEFTEGIKTDKKWEKVDDNHWILKTKFKDPVINDYRKYSLVFHRLDTVVILSKASFDGHDLSDSELEDLAIHIIRNYKEHLSVK